MYRDYVSFVLKMFTVVYLDENNGVGLFIIVLRGFDEFVVNKIFYDSYFCLFLFYVLFMFNLLLLLLMLLLMLIVLTLFELLIFLNI